MSSAAAIYLRQSQDRPGDGAAVERQGTDAATLVRLRGWELVGTFADSDTSAKGGKPRPGFEALLKAIGDGRCTVVVAWSWERLERNRRDGLRLIELCQEKNATIALVRGSDIDMSTPAGRLVADMLSAMARHEIEQKADRQCRAHTQRAAAGAWPPGRRPYGYHVDGQVNEVEAEHVRQAFASLLAGASVASIVRDLNAATCSRNSLGRPWQGHGTRAMLCNPRYAALRSHRSAVVGAGVWEPIIDVSTYHAAITRLGDPGRRTQKGTARKWLGSFRYRCGKPGCGSQLRCDYSAAGGYRVYRCLKCSHARKADPIDELVENLLVARLRRKDLAELLAGDEEDTAPLREEARILRIRLDEIADERADGLLTGPQAHRATQKVEQKLADVESRLAIAGSDSALSSVARAPDPGAAYLAADVTVRGAVLDALMQVTMLPVLQGRRAFDPRTVEIAWQNSVSPGTG